MSILIRDNERSVHLCELTLASRADNNFRFPFDEFKNYLLNNYSSFIYKRDKDKLSYRIKDIQIFRDRYFVILFQLIDKDGSNPVFGNITNGELRPVEKGNDEGIACSNHLVIDMKVNDSRPNRYNASLESMTGLSRSLITDLLNHVIKNISYQSSTNTHESHSPRVSLSFYAVQNFEDKLKKGEIKSITAFQDTPKFSKGIDDSSFSVPFKEIKMMSFEKPGKKIASVFNYLARCIGKAKKDGYTKLKVVSMANKRSETGTIELEDIEDGVLDKIESDVMQYPFSEKKLISLNTPIQISIPNIHTELVDKMIQNIII